MLPFFEGMLEAAGPDVQIIDGNESAYNYSSSKEFYRSYWGIRQDALSLIAPELRSKYNAQVRVGQAVYLDMIFNLRPDYKGGYASSTMSAKERSRYCQHNVYYALKTSDEYAWIYGENLAWWPHDNARIKNTELPFGIEEALRAARAKIQNDVSLGFNLDGEIVLKK